MTTFYNKSSISTKPTQDAGIWQRLSRGARIHRRHGKFSHPRKQGVSLPRSMHRSIVVAQVDGGFTVKYLYKRADRVKLVPANPTYPEIVLKEGQELVICGVVTSAIKRFAG